MLGSVASECGADRSTIRRGLLEYFLKLTPIGLTRYLEKGGAAKGPRKNPFSTALVRRSSTICGFEVAETRFRHSFVGISIKFIMVSKPWRKPSHKYSTKSRFGYCLNSVSNCLILTGVEAESGDAVR
jgi:hypothetical protein